MPTMAPSFSAKLGNFERGEPFAIIMNTSNLITNAVDGELDED